MEYEFIREFYFLGFIVFIEVIEMFDLRIILGEVSG